MPSRRLVIAMLAAGAAAPAALATAAPATSKSARPTSKSSDRTPAGKAAPKSSGRAPAATHKVPDDMVMGSDKAPVTVIEYASVACPVCARFNNEVFPSLKQFYIDTGQVRYIAREILAHNPPMAAAGFLLARCAGTDKYFQVTDAIYHTRDQIEQSGDIRAALAKLAAGFGISEKAFDVCINNPASLAALNARVINNAKLGDVQGTPTFWVNGKKFAEGYQTFAQIAGFIETAKLAPAAG